MYHLRRRGYYEDELLDKKRQIPYHDLLTMRVPVSRYKPFIISRASITFLSVLTLSLPLVHLHPRVTHADDFGEHTHSGVIHTIFSSESASHPSSSADRLEAENSTGLSRPTIYLHLFAQRPPTETTSNVLTAVWASSEFFLSPIAMYTSLMRSHVVSPRSSWMGSPPSSRAPPSHSLY